MIVKERIIVPEAVTVKEQVVVPDAVAVKETVSVPVEVRIERMPAYHPDPLWPDLESCPAGHIWAVCYSFDEGDYDICFYQTYVEGKVDWGDGESEDILNRYARASHHKFARGTGSPDSRGREFWLVDIDADTTSDIYGGLTFSRYGNNSYNTLDIDGRNGIVALCIGEGLKFQVTVSEEYIHPLLEYVRVKGDEVWKPVSFGLIYSVKKVRYNEKARVEYLIGSPVPASYFDFPFHCRYFANVSYLGNSRIDREVLDFSTCELSSTNYNSLEITSRDYREVFNEYKDTPGAVFLVDPPYLSTEVGTYTMYWKLSDYLDVLTVLTGHSFIYFTSNKSSILELCEWIGKNQSLGNPFKGCMKSEFNAHINYNATYTDIMLYKRCRAHDSGGII